MLDVYDEIEGYFNLLIERIHLIAQQRCVSTTQPHFYHHQLFVCDLFKYFLTNLILICRHVLR
jgi:hypothetical protein